MKEKISYSRSKCFRRLEEIFQNKALTNRHRITTGENDIIIVNGGEWSWATFNSPRTTAEKQIISHAIRQIRSVASTQTPWNRTVSPTNFSILVHKLDSFGRESVASLDTPLARNDGWSSWRQRWWMIYHGWATVQWGFLCTNVTAVHEISRTVSRRTGGPDGWRDGESIASLPPFLITSIYHVEDVTMLEGKALYEEVRVCGV